MTATVSNIQQSTSTLFEKNKEVFEKIVTKEIKNTEEAKQFLLDKKVEGIVFRKSASVSNDNEYIFLGTISFLIKPNNVKNSRIKLYTEGTVSLEHIQDTRFQNLLDMTKSFIASTIPFKLMHKTENDFSTYIYHTPEQFFKEFDKV